MCEAPKIHNLCAHYRSGPYITGQDSQFNTPGRFEMSFFINNSAENSPIKMIFDSGRRSWSALSSTSIPIFFPCTVVELRGGEGGFPHYNLEIINSLNQVNYLGNTVNPSLVNNTTDKCILWVIQNQEYNVSDLSFSRLVIWIKTDGVISEFVLVSHILTRDLQWNLVKFD